MIGLGYGRRVFVLLLAGLLGACSDLGVDSPFGVDLEEELKDPENVETLISSSFWLWFQGVYRRFGPGLLLSNQAFQSNPPWSNHGMELYGRLPRVGIANQLEDAFSGNLHWTWEYSYRALFSANQGLRGLEDPEVVSQLSPERVARGRAFGKFVQGLSLATVALMYDRGFVATEATDVNEPQALEDYRRVMRVALASFDESIDLSSSASFSIPLEWARTEMSSDGLARLAHSYKARFRAQMARTAEERADVDWNAVMSDVDAGVQGSHLLSFDWTQGWNNEVLLYSAYPYWNQLTYFMYGMADQGGAVAEWLALPLSERSHLLPGGREVLIKTPDLRFPQGSTVEEQRLRGGAYFRVLNEAEAGQTWKKPDRGTWRWSWYKAGPRGLEYTQLGVFDQPEVTLAEMRLLKAEGLYRSGDLAGAAAIVNETRTAAGLNPTDASGTNTSCVPRLPDGSCGDLWEMLKWEKRMETVWTGVAGANWFFDGRGWGDLWKDTPLHFPVPCPELHVIEDLPCNSVGGPGGEMGAPVSTYRFPSEG